MRLGGVDRFETSRKIVQYAFAGGTSSAYVVTGLDFPDALSASASATAGSKGVPVVLVNGGATTLNGETNASLQELGASSFTVLGGPSAISSGIESGLDGLGTVSRLAGTDRFETSVLVNKTVFGNPDHAYFASGAQFPDALAGSVFAGSLIAPLYIVPPTCVPQTALSGLTRFGTSKVTLIGGASGLNGAVGEMKSCKLP